MGCPLALPCPVMTCLASEDLCLWNSGWSEGCPKSFFVMILPLLFPSPVFGGVAFLGSQVSMHWYSVSFSRTEHFGLTVFVCNAGQVHSFC